MKNIILLFVLIAISFTSCDGKKSKSESLKDAVKEFNDTIGPIEVIKYFPDTYAETITDTLLTNGFQIKIKAFTDMSSNYLNEFTEDSIIYKHYYRNYIADVIVYKNETEVFNKRINNSFFINYDESYSSLLEDKNLNGFWINEKNALSKDNIIIDFLFCKPETQSCIYFELYIDDKGDFKIIKT